MVNAFNADLLKLYCTRMKNSFKALIRNIYSDVITPKKYWAILLSQYLTISINFLFFLTYSLMHHHFGSF